MTNIKKTQPKGFLKISAVEVSNEKLKPHVLEYLDRGDSVAIMLKTDTNKYVMVEQFRIGPASKDANQTSTLEPVAGMIDAGETPEQAVLRECKEEIGIDPIWVTKTESFWMCPGVSNEKMHLFIGECTQPNDIGGTDEDEYIVVKQYTQDEMHTLKKEGKLNTPHALLLWNAWQTYNANLTMTPN